MSFVFGSACHRIGIFALIAGLLLAPVVVAQDKEPRPLFLSDATLFLMIRVGPHLSEDEIVTTLKRGISKSGGAIVGEPYLRAVSPLVFEEFEALSNPVAPVVSPEKAGDGVGIRQLPTRELMWEFRLPKPEQVMKKLTVKYKKAGDKEFEPNDPRKGGPLTLIVPGMYALKMEANDLPVTYEATVAELGAKDQVLKGAWPVHDRFYVVALRQFTGNRNLLFRIIQDPNEVPNPLENVRLRSDLLFIFASMDSTAGRLRRSLIDGNELIVRVEGPVNRRAHRVWMYFPATEAEAKKLHEEMTKIGKAEDVSAKVRAMGTVPFGNEQAIGADATGRWLELQDTESRNVFQRRVPLRDYAKLHAKFPSAYRLLVWEFDDGTNPPAAIRIDHPEDGRTFVVVEEIKGWPAAIKEKVAGSK
jgi:hypothetical protein